MDILSKLVQAEKEEAPKKLRTALRYVVLTGDGSPTDHKLYTLRRAEKLVKEAASQGRDLYFSGPMRVTIEAEKV